MEYIKLCDIASINAGGTPSRDNNSYWNGQIPWLKISDIKGKYTDSCTEYITEEGLNNSSAKYFKKNTILYTIFATIGETSILKFDATTNQAIAGIKLINDNFLVDYLYYYLKSLKKRVKHDSKGVAQNNINLTYLKKLNVPNVNINIQKQIVKDLTNIEELILRSNKMQENLDNIVKSQFIEMFGDPIQNEKAWNSSILNEVTDVRDGTHDSPKYHDRGYPFVTSKNLIDGKIDFSTCQFISEKDYLHFNDRSRINDGDILMPMIGTIGGAIIVKKDREFSIKNVALIKFTKDNTKINRTFILYILNSDSMNNYFELTKKGGTQKFMALGVIRNIPIIVPPIELQNEFAKFVNQIDKSKYFGDGIP
ncbi:MAG: restriction endonuclease subunit S [Coprobacillus sp.]|nr:restriction endonuclease subunit S [Coprobacillus sp.]